METTSKASGTSPRRRLSFGKRLRALRAGRGWTQRRLAGEAGLTQPLLSALESGRKGPGWETVCALAAALEVSTEAFR